QPGLCLSPRQGHLPPPRSATLAGDVEARSPLQGAVAPGREGQRTHLAPAAPPAPAAAQSRPQALAAGSFVANPFGALRPSQLAGPAWIPAVTTPRGQRPHEASSPAISASAVTPSPALMSESPRDQKRVLRLDGAADCSDLGDGEDSPSAPKFQLLRRLAAVEAKMEAESLAREKDALVRAQ
ncbi:unnamed protein product, partial [Polarella glacialis]